MEMKRQDVPSINDFVFGGKRELTKPLRVLVAGCGTGDAVIYLAMQANTSPTRRVVCDSRADSVDL